MYGAAGVEYSELAEKRLQSYTEAGYSHLPICMAKTQYSLSCDSAAKGVPTGFVVTVRDVRAAIGAGYIYPICGDIMTVPGLPTRPGFYDVDMDLETGRVVGLF
jgi:formyltetrahydrofolate synthetase